MPNEPRKPGRPPTARTRPVSLRVDVELWERLEHHAPLQRRSVGNLLQWLVADALDRLDEGEHFGVWVKNCRELLAKVRPELRAQAVEWQRHLVEQLQSAGVPPPLPRPPATRRRKRKR